MQETSSWVPIFPEQASTFAWQVDALYFYLILITAFFTIGIVAAIIFFFIKYREKEKFATGAEIHGSVALETALVGYSVCYFDDDFSRRRACLLQSISPAG